MRHTERQKINAVTLYTKGRMNLKEVCEKYKISDSTLYYWTKMYKDKVVRKDPNKYSEEEKNAMIEEWEKSGETIHAFSTKKCIDYSCLYRWTKDRRQKIKKENEIEKVKQENEILREKLNLTEKILSELLQAMQAMQKVTDLASEKNKNFYEIFLEAKGELDKFNVG